ncbi:basic proline-rich protein-like [Dasypus novemcinctus]|uniref:basic proline-rich protein-like n=1 Tax=Dasypus novemcinctus TaxID=9361 RepID=UPI0026600F00|nr:basic proline-rich protein-like [Dasypus novemcinctus]
MPGADRSQAGRVGPGDVPCSPGPASLPRLASKDEASSVLQRPEGSSSQGAKGFPKIQKRLPPPCRPPFPKRGLRIWSKEPTPSRSASLPRSAAGPREPRSPAGRGARLPATPSPARFLQGEPQPFHCHKEKVPGHSPRSRRPPRLQGQRDGLPELILPPRTHSATECGKGSSGARQAVFGSHLFLGHLPSSSPTWDPALRRSPSSPQAQSKRGQLICRARLASLSSPRQAAILGSSGTELRYPRRGVAQALSQPRRRHLPGRAPLLARAARGPGPAPAGTSLSAPRPGLPLPKCASHAPSSSEPGARQARATRERAVGPQEGCAPRPGSRGRPASPPASGPRSRLCLRPGARPPGTPSAALRPATPTPDHRRPRARRAPASRPPPPPPHRPRDPRAGRAIGHRGAPRSARGGRQPCPRGSGARYLSLRAGKRVCGRPSGLAARAALLRQPPPGAKGRASAGLCAAPPPAPRPAPRPPARPCSASGRGPAEPLPGPPRRGRRRGAAGGGRACAEGPRAPLHRAPGPHASPHPQKTGGASQASEGRESTGRRTETGAGLSLPKWFGALRKEGAPSPFARPFAPAGLPPNLSSASGPPPTSFSPHSHPAPATAPWPRRCRRIRFHPEEQPRAGAGLRRGKDGSALGRGGVQCLPLQGPRR